MLLQDRPSGTFHERNTRPCSSKRCPVTEFDVATDGSLQYDLIYDMTLEARQASRLGIL